MPNCSPTLLNGSSPRLCNHYSLQLEFNLIQPVAGLPEGQKIAGLCIKELLAPRNASI